MGTKSVANLRSILLTIPEQHTFVPPLSQQLFFQLYTSARCCILRFSPLQLTDTVVFDLLTHIKNKMKSHNITLSPFILSAFLLVSEWYLVRICCCCYPAAFLFQFVFSLLFFI